MAVEDLARARSVQSADLDECSIPVDVWAKLGEESLGPLSGASTRKLQIHF
jgi:hypothetical protein